MLPNERDSRLDGPRGPACHCSLSLSSQSTLVRRWPGPATRAASPGERQWGLGFALAHTIHLVALGINVIVYAPGRTLADR